MMVDPARIRSLLDRLGDEVEHLRRLASYESERLANDADLLAAVKYRFVVGIEVCIDIGEHIIASEGLRAPQDSADVFSVLAEKSYLPSADVPTLQQMARFRNLLVHGYGVVDDTRVIEILRLRLDDFGSFRRAIARRALEET